MELQARLKEQSALLKIELKFLLDRLDNEQQACVASLPDTDKKAATPRISSSGLPVQSIPALSECVHAAAKRLQHGSAIPEPPSHNAHFATDAVLREVGLRKALSKPLFFRLPNSQSV